MLPRPEPRSVDLDPNDHPLRKWRIENKKNRDDLGAALGVSGVTVWRWEKRRQFPERQFWKTIEHVTGVSVVDLAIATSKAAE
jgi:transcriptional regulator with XRE-family HTH domain